MSSSKSLFSDDNKRIKRRRRAEWRLKSYGILAICVAGFALFSLLFSVFGQAVFVIKEPYVILNVTPDRDRLDLSDDPTPKEILRAEYLKWMKKQWRESYPDVTKRSDKKALYDVISQEALFEFAEYMSQNPDRLDQSFEHPFLASDTTALYLKGEYGSIELLDASGSISIEIDDGEVEITSDGTPFAQALIQSKAKLIEDARVIRQTAARQNNAVLTYTKRLSSVTDTNLRAELEDKLQSSTEKRDALLQDAEALERRSADQAAAETLDDTSPSYFIFAADGIIKLEALTPSNASGRVLIAPKGPLKATQNWQLQVSELPASARKLSDLQIAVIENLKSEGKIKSVFNTRFLTSGDSTVPELAGIKGALLGSFWTLLVTIIIAFPIGVAGAIYLEEFAPKNRLTQFIEVAINNLAAVPSIVFGLLGLSVVIGVFGVPRSTPFAGGIVLALMTLPTIIIAARAAIRAVPPSIRDAALGVGASHVQTSVHHVLPLSMPGILTGTIIGMAQALGETAPLLLIGMNSFVTEIPQGPSSPSATMPTVIYIWFSNAERLFAYKAAAAIVVLLVFLVVMNAIAIILRRRFERRW